MPINHVWIALQPNWPRHGAAPLRLLFSTLLSLWFSVLLCAVAYAKVAVVNAIELQGDKTRAQLVLSMMGEVKADHFLLENPNRLVVDLPELIFSKTLPQPPAQGLVSSLQFGNITANHSRLVLGVDGFAVVDEFELIAVSEGQYELVVELAAADQTAFQAEVARQKLKMTSRTEIALKGDRAKPKAKKDNKFYVVVDPGHGGIDGGAVGAGGRIIEKHVTLAVGQYLREELEKLGHYEVVMTRQGDSFLTLSERVRIARANHANLFISIHADSLGQGDVRGATIYTLSRKASDQVSEALAANENRADLVAGLDIAPEDDGVAGILIDLARLESKGFSRIFATSLLEKLRGQVKLINNPIRSAGFKVLKAPDVPSVLVELGYLSNDRDAQLLAKKDWQQKVGRLIADAIENFRSNSQTANLGK